jgi:hypothetical protein
MAAAIYSKTIDTYRFVSDHSFYLTNQESFLKDLQKWLEYSKTEFQSLSFYERNISPICQSFKILLFSKITTDKKINEISLVEIFKFLNIFNNTSIRFEHSVDNFSQFKDFNFLREVFNTKGFSSLEKELQQKEIYIDLETRKNLIAIAKIMSSFFVIDGIYSEFKKNIQIKSKSNFITGFKENKLKAIALYKLDEKNLILEYLATDPREFFEKKDIKLMKGPGRAIMENLIEIAIKENKDIKVFVIDNIDSFYLHMGFEKGDYKGNMILTVEKAKTIYSHLLKTA